MITLRELLKDYHVDADTLLDRPVDEPGLYDRAVVTTMAKMTAIGGGYTRTLNLEIEVQV
jgi:hypothetical protein